MFQCTQSIEKWDNAMKSDNFWYCTVRRATIKKGASVKKSNIFILGAKIIFSPTLRLGRRGLCEGERGRMKRLEINNMIDTTRIKWQYRKIIESEIKIYWMYVLYNKYFL